MRICPKCNAVCEDAVAFCGACGTALAAQASQEMPVVNETPVVSETPAVRETMAPQATLAEKPKKKARFLLWLIPLLVVLLGAGVVVGGLLTDWFGLVKPLEDVLAAAKKTLGADNLTVAVSTQYGDGEEQETTVRLVVDRDKETLTYIVEGEDVVMHYDGMDFYKSEALTLAYAQTNPLLDELACKGIDSILDGDVDWSLLLKAADAEEELSEKDPEKAVQAIYEQCLCRSRWLKEYGGMTRDGNKIVFEPDDVEALCDELMRVIKEADVSDEAVTWFEDSISDIGKHVDFMKLTIVLDDEYVESVMFSYSDGGDPVTTTWRFEEIGKTVIAEEDAKARREEVLAYIDEHTCDTCEAWLTDEELKTHGDCDYCDEHGEMQLYGGLPRACASCKKTLESLVDSWKTSLDVRMLMNISGFDFSQYEAYLPKNTSIVLRMDINIDETLHMYIDEDSWNAFIEVLVNAVVQQLCDEYGLTQTQFYAAAGVTRAEFVSQMQLENRPDSYDILTGQWFLVDGDLYILKEGAPLLEAAKTTFTLSSDLLTLEDESDDGIDGYDLFPLTFTRIK